MPPDSHILVDQQIEQSTTTPSKAADFFLSVLHRGTTNINPVGLRNIPSSRKPQGPNSLSSSLIFLFRTHSWLKRPTQHKTTSYSIIISPHGTKQRTNLVPALSLHPSPFDLGLQCNIDAIKPASGAFEKKSQSPVGLGKEGRGISALVMLVMLVKFLVILSLSMARGCCLLFNFKPA